MKPCPYRRVDPWEAKALSIVLEMQLREAWQRRRDTSYQKGHKHERVKMASPSRPLPAQPPWSGIMLASSSGASFAEGR